MSIKEKRINNLLHNGRMLCVPLDHGVTNIDISHLSNFTRTANDVISGGASSIIIHKGLVRFLPADFNAGLIVHVSASTENVRPVQKVLVCEVEEAIKLGADAISVHVNLHNDFEKQMIQDLAKISRDCNAYNMPLLAMMYIRDNNNQDVSTPELVKHSIRLATELGADIVKIGANWEPDELRQIIRDALIPVVIAGGDVLEAEQLYTLTREAMKTGILGISFGRNVFMSKKPANTIKQLADIIYN